MIKLKTAAIAAALVLSLAGPALAQVQPGLSGSPGRGNSDPIARMRNGAPLSNGQTVEPGVRMNQFGRSRPRMHAARAMRPRSFRGRRGAMRRPLRGSPNSPNSRSM